MPSRPRPEPEKYLRAIIDNTNLVAYLKHADGRYIYVNRKYEQVARVPASAVVGRRDRDLFPPAIADLFRAQDLRVIAAKKPVEFDETIPLPDGMLSWITNKFPLLDEKGEVWAVGGVCTDITERKRRDDAALAAEREKLAVTLRSIDDAVVSADARGRVLLLNPAAERLTGWTEDQAAGRPLAEVCRFAREEGDGRALLARDGTRRAVAVREAPLRDRDGAQTGRVLTIRDVTEFLRAREELERMGRLESLATMAGGVAHDFNNLLNCVAGNLSLLEAGPRGAAGAAAAAEARTALKRAAALTQQLMSIARGGESRREATRVADLLRESARLAASGAAARVAFALAADLWDAEADPVEIGQVVQNLVLNAVQAMGGRGTVTVSARNRGPESGSGPAGLRPGRYVEVEVADEGPGVPVLLRDRVFEPYFTTKKEGHGLGLAVAFSVVKKHGGLLSLESPEGEGARFTFLLPAAGGAPSRAKRKTR